MGAVARFHYIRRLRGLRSTKFLGDFGLRFPPPNLPRLRGSRRLGVGEPGEGLRRVWWFAPCSGTPSLRFPLQARGTGEWGRIGEGLKRSELERHLRAHGCQLKREGAKHAIWEKAGSDKTSAVPRHNEIKRNTARRICDDLAVPRPRGL
jgi:hypothetical protein